MDVNNDGTVDWEEMSSFMVEMGMRGWAESGIVMPTYSYAGSVDSAQPTLAADQVGLCPDNLRVTLQRWNRVGSSTEGLFVSAKKRK